AHSKWLETNKSRLHTLGTTSGPLVSIAADRHQEERDAAPPDLDSMAKQAQDFATLLASFDRTSMSGGDLPSAAMVSAGRGGRQRSAGRRNRDREDQGLNLGVSHAKRRRLDGGQSGDPAI